MSLNAIIRHMEQATPETTAGDTEFGPLNDKEREYAERIFFGKELRECNPGMSEVKFKGRVELAIARARMLYREIYGR